MLTPNQMFEAFEAALKVTLEETPHNYIDSEPQEAYRDIVARFVLRLSQNGYVLRVQSKEEYDMGIKAQQPKPRVRGPKVCQENLNGVGPCVLSEGHGGQHRTHMGDKWG